MTPRCFFGPYLSCHFPRWADSSQGWVLLTICTAKRGGVGDMYYFSPHSPSLFLCVSVCMSENV